MQASFMLPLKYFLKSGFQWQLLYQLFPSQYFFFETCWVHSNRIILWKKTVKAAMICFISFKLLSLKTLKTKIDSNVLPIILEEIMMSTIY